jgi:hypothetical protein
MQVNNVHRHTLNFQASHFLFRAQLVYFFLLNSVLNLIYKPLPELLILAATRLSHFHNQVEWFNPINQSIGFH